MARFEIQNGYKYLVTGDKGFETYYQLEKVEDEKKEIVEDKPKKKKKNKNVENENDTLAS